MGFFSDHPLLISIGTSVVLGICALILFFVTPASIREAEKIIVSSPHKSKNGSYVKSKHLGDIIKYLRVITGFILLGTVGMLSQAPY